MIYSFHMPLFFAISGFLTYKEQYDNKLIRKRAVQLLLPFISWAILMPLFREGSFNILDTQRALLYPGNGLWFLYNLFVYCVIFNLSEKLAKEPIKQEYIFGAIFFALYILMAVMHTLLNVTQVCWYIPFFAIGYYGRKYKVFLAPYLQNLIIFGRIAVLYHFG